MMAKSGREARLRREEQRQRSKQRKGSSKWFLPSPSSPSSSSSAAPSESPPPGADTGDRSVDGRDDAAAACEQSLAGKCCLRLLGAVQFLFHATLLVLAVLFFMTNYPLVFDTATRQYFLPHAVVDTSITLESLGDWCPSSAIQWVCLVFVV